MHIHPCSLLALPYLHGGLFCLYGVVWCMLHTCRAQAVLLLLLIKWSTHQVPGRRVEILAGLGYPEIVVWCNTKLGVIHTSHSPPLLVETLDFMIKNKRV